MFLFFEFMDYMYYFDWGENWGGLRFEGDCGTDRNGGVLEGGASHIPCGPPNHRLEAKAEGTGALCVHQFRAGAGFGGALKALVLSSKGKSCD